MKPGIKVEVVGKVADKSRGTSVPAVESLTKRGRDPTKPHEMRALLREGPRTGADSHACSTNRSAL